jgi:hypothetical protein
MHLWPALFSRRRVACRDYSAFPVAEPLALPSAMLLLPGGGALNTCTTEALQEMLRLLKRAFWPCAWDTGLDPPTGGGVGSAGGFRCAALCGCGISESLESLE